jgi:hypothetical protein
MRSLASLRSLIRRKPKEQLDATLVERYVRLVGPRGFEIAQALERVYGVKVANQRLLQGIEMREAQAEGRFARKMD